MPDMESHQKKSHLGRGRPLMLDSIVAVADEELGQLANHRPMTGTRRPSPRSVLPVAPVDTSHPTGRRRNGVFPLPANITASECFSGKRGTTVRFIPP
jgi:hypothetical protein